MLEIVNFVSSSIVGGVAGNLAYDELKVILGNSFHKLSSYLHNNEYPKFEGALEMLLEDKTLVTKIEALMDGKEIDNSFIDIKKSKLDIDLGQIGKVTNSFKKIDDSTIKIR